MQNEIIEGFRLSPQQKHLWLLQGSDDQPVYRTRGTIRIEGALNPERLKTVLAHLVEQHEILRTTFHRLPGLKVPVQVITAGGVFSFDEHDGSGLPPKEQEAWLEALFHEADRSPLDLEKGPALHLSLVSLSPARHLLHLNLPALCADATTISNLTCELSRGYADLTGGEGELISTTLRQAQDGGSIQQMQYADLSEWQNELLESEEAESGIEYWRRQISDVLPLKLPFENPPAMPKGARPGDLPGFAPRVFRALEWSKEGVAQMEHLIQESHTSAATFFLTCWGVLLWRLTGQSDFILGVGCHGRTYEELRAAFGLFAKYLPLRFHLEERFRFHEVLAQVDESMGEAFDWQEYFSWDPVVPSTHWVTHPAFLPLNFDFEDGSQTYAAADVSFSIDNPDACMDRFKVKLSVAAARNETLMIAFHYDASFFREVEIARLAGEFQALLESSLDHPYAAISELNILSRAERHQLLFDFNDVPTVDFDKLNPADVPGDRCIHQQIEEQAARTPEAIALAFKDFLLTYAELNARANQLAHYLRHRGVGPDVPLGLCCQRSPEMIVGILGILKAGGAYVPLDASYPKDRLAFLLEDAQVPVLLTQQRRLSALPTLLSRVVCLDTDWKAIAQESAANPDPLAGPENLAYIIYTSGSTGQPKGVLISHQNLVHSTQVRMHYYGEPVTRFLLLPSFAFDSSVAGIFWTLCQGGTLVLPQDSTERDISQVAAMIARHQITHLLCLPSLYALLMTEANPQELASLRTVMVAGEACPKALVERHCQMFGHIALFNEYGPTEGTVWSSVYDCRSHELQTPVPIGRPIANTQIYILDAHLQPVPIGVPGELHIGGAGLAQGYLNRPELTSEKFIPHPFSEVPEARLYKTGDLARYRSDGVIEFIGRTDQQVKIRGYRIELGEIEAVLRGHPRVQETVVIAREDVPGDKRLVAYLVRNGNERLTVSELRDFLLEKLPEYMLPSAFVFLEALPLTPNGKVDRQALPAPDQTRPDLEAAYVAPRNELEHFLTDIWRETLKLEKIGVYDHFFELGGNSIQAAIFINKLQAELGEYIHVATLFRVPRTADFAAYLKAHYPSIVSKFGGAELASLEGGHKTPLHESREARKVDAAKVAHIRQLIPPLPSCEADALTPKNSRAIFILCPPRSGSTLLRAMLAGHPRLFAPPELELLNFNTLEERKAAFTGPEQFLGEGLLRAIMEIKGCDAEQAQGIIADGEKQKLTTKQFYQRLQEWGDRILVDKTACYVLDPEILKRADAIFENALYIHLLRHPYGMIRSFEGVRLDQVFFRYEHPFSTRELAELVWVISHQNTLELLQRVPRHRQYQVKFEDLVKQPVATLKGICKFLGLVFHPEMVQPYENPEKKMLDGISEFSKMQGDPRFHEHQAIDPEVADRWRTQYTEDFLGEITWQLAESLGYKRETFEDQRALLARRESAGLSLSKSTAIPALSRDEERLLANLEGLSSEEVRSLLDNMLAGEDGDD